jgi:hypothetical protein
MESLRTIFERVIQFLLCVQLAVQHVVVGIVPYGNEIRRWLNAKRIDSSIRFCISRLSVIDLDCIARRINLPDRIFTDFFIQIDLRPWEDKIVMKISGWTTHALVPRSSRLWRTSGWFSLVYSRQTSRIVFVVKSANGMSRRQSVAFIGGNLISVHPASGVHIFTGFGCNRSGQFASEWSSFPCFWSSAWSMS